MWNGYEDYQQWTRDGAGFSQYPIQGGHWGWDGDAHWPVEGQAATTTSPSGQYVQQYEMMDERLRAQHHPAGDLAMRGPGGRMPPAPNLPVLGGEKRMGQMPPMPNIPASSKGKSGAAMGIPAGKGIQGKGDKRRGQPTEHPEGNSIVTVKQLIGAEKKLGLNLRGMKVENFCEHEAAAMGWKRGDIITAVNGTKVTSFDEFNRVFDKAKQQIAIKPITFRVQRNLDTPSYGKAEKGQAVVAPTAAASQAWLSEREGKSQGSKAKGDPKVKVPPGTFTVKILADNWCISGTEYICNSNAGISIRNEPGCVTGTRSGMKVEGSEKFKVSDALMGADQRMYLKLSDDRGWIFDDCCLEKKNPTVEKINIKTGFPKHTGDEYERLIINLRRLRETYSAPRKPQADYASVE